MAIVKIISSKGSLRNILNYITNPAKTDNKLISGKDCVPESSYDEMMSVKNMYGKTTGNNYFHVMQSFSPKDDLDYQKAHEIGVKFAEYFKNYQVVIATHKDRDHIHNHLVINSVSFEDGKKVHMTKKDVEDLKEYSNKLCAEENLSVISTKKSQVKYVGKNELAVAERGESWKFKLMNDIDYCMSISNSREEYIKNMNKLNYQVMWTDTRKYITYTTKDGNKCRDKSLHDTKYLKESMENEFRRIKEEKSSYTKQSSSSFNNKNGILSNATRNIEGNIQLESYNNGRNCYGKEENYKFTRRINKEKYSNEGRNDKSCRTEDRKSNLSFETRFTGNGRGTKTENIKNQVENRSNSIIDRFITISNLVSNPQINNRPKRRIRRHRTLSKQAMKEYAIKQANSSGFDWFEDDELER